MRFLAAPLLAAVAAFPMSASAVPMVSGAVDDSAFAGTSLARGVTESNSIRLIPEQQNVSVMNLAVDHLVTTGTTLTMALLGTPGTLNGVVSSFLLHFDPVGAPSPAVTASGSVVFDDPIVGLIFNNNVQDATIPTSLNNTDALLGLAGVTYDATTGRRFLEGEGGDTVTVSAGSFAPLLRQLDLTMRSSGLNIDNLRVLTAAVPSQNVDGPSPLALLLLGLGAALCARRARGPLASRAG